MDLLGNAPVPQALMALGIPIMIGMLINALYNLSLIHIFHKHTFQYRYFYRLFLLILIDFLCEMAVYTCLLYTSTEAVKYKHTTTEYGLTFSCRSGILFITLPSGRNLVYVKPRAMRLSLIHI